MVNRVTLAVSDVSNFRRTWKEIREYRDDMQKGRGEDPEYPESKSYWKYLFRSASSVVKSLDRGKVEDGSFVFSIPEWVWERDSESLETYGASLVG